MAGLHRGTGSENVFRRRGHSFQHRQTERRRDGPQLANLERPELLVTRYEVLQLIRVHLQARLPGGHARQVHHARQVGLRSDGETREAPVVVRGKAARHLADGLADQVLVIEQPLRDARLCVRGLGIRLQRTVDRGKRVIQPLKAVANRPTAARLAGDRMTLGQVEGDAVNGFVRARQPAQACHDAGDSEEDQVDSDSNPSGISRGTSCKTRSGSLPCMIRWLATDP